MNANDRWDLEVAAREGHDSAAFVAEREASELDAMKESARLTALHEEIQDDMDRARSEQAAAWESLPEETRAVLEAAWRWGNKSWSDPFAEGNPFAKWAELDQTFLANEEYMSYLFTD